ncbi:MAG: carboxypeptidase regulatory-like domain-containing protein [Planctomycetes bacterium]|nr:carboxypeptidase regulatory-like domain-containing protein [Planctomycetota bacterium]
MRSTWVGLAAVVAAIGIVVGCDKGPTESVAKAGGTVTMNGEPVASARVTFHPVSGSRISHGTTDAMGKFTLSTFGVNDGALIGKHKVTVSKVEGADSTPKVDVEALRKGGVSAMPGYADQMGVGGKKAEQPKQLIPEKYSDKEQSTFEVEVTATGTNDFPIDLK